MVRVIYILLATAMFFWQDNYFLLGDVQIGRAHV